MEEERHNTRREYIAIFCTFSKKNSLGIIISGAATALSLTQEGGGEVGGERGE
jgi:hypothetical protein